MKTKIVDVQDKAAFLEAISQQFPDLKKDEAEIVMDMGMELSTRAAKAVTEGVQVLPINVASAAQIVALEIMASTIDQTSEMNLTIRSMAADMVEAGGITWETAMGEIAQAAILSRLTDNTITGDSCRCMACSIRRAVIGPDPTKDARDKAQGAAESVH